MMLFEMLKEYIDYRLYQSINDVHEMLVVYHITNKLSDSEFSLLFNQLYPKKDNDVLDCIENGISVIPIEKEIKYPMPEKAKEILEKMIKANKLENQDNKLDLYISTEQLTVEESIKLREVFLDENNQ